MSFHTHVNLRFPGIAHNRRTIRTASEPTCAQTQLDTACILRSRTYSQSLQCLPVERDGRFITWTGVGL